jgi:hypothetical protein
VVVAEILQEQLPKKEKKRIKKNINNKITTLLIDWENPNHHDV